MNNKIKKSYSNIKMTEEAKEKIYRQIIQRGDDSLGQKTIPGDRKIGLPGWKTGIAACLAAALIIPAGVYAAGKLSEYMSVNIEKNNYQASIELHKNNKPVTETADKDMTYIQVKANSGSDYKLDFISEGMHCYTYKDGTEAEKDFSYEILYMDKSYMDKSSDAILNLNDLDSMEEIEINGHRALFYKYFTAPKGSRYTDAYTPIYLYVFYEEYGYIIEYHASLKLGKKQFIALAQKTTVTEVSKKEASPYTLLSDYLKDFKTYYIEKNDDTGKKEMTRPVKKQNEIFEHSGIVYQVTDVKVSSKVVKGDSSEFYLLDAYQGLWNKSRKLKPYIREIIKQGDGVSEPERLVVGEEKIQPKMVYVTMKITGKSNGMLFQLPTLNFFEKSGQKYYDTPQYQKYNLPYNRPIEIDCAFALLDFEPFYFKETTGGKNFDRKIIKKDSEQVFHFAYIVDEDMTDRMYLCPNDITNTYDGPYIDISQVEDNKIE